MSKIGRCPTSHAQQAMHITTDITSKEETSQFSHRTVGSSFAGPLDLLDKGRRSEVDLMSSQDTPAAEDHSNECDQE